MKLCDNNIIVLHTVQDVSGIIEYEIICLNGPCNQTCVNHWQGRSNMIQSSLFAPPCGHISIDRMPSACCVSQEHTINCLTSEDVFLMHVDGINHDINVVKVVCQIIKVYTT